jgi:hypothetical protein
MSNLTLEQQNTALTRQQEILFDLSMNLGRKWADMNGEQCGNIIDMVQGSRGLFDLMAEWTKEFDAKWEALPVDSELREDYIGEIDEFFLKKWEVFCN